MLQKYLLITIMLILINGCGESGTCCNSTNSSSTNSSSTTTTTTVDVAVERGSVYFATVKDSNNNSASYSSSNNYSGLSNVYSFDSEPNYPITVSGGYIDVNNDGKLDTTNDIKLDINLTSYSQYVSTLTTLIENNDTKKQYFMDTFNLTEDQLLKNIPTSVNKDAVIASNAAFVILKKGYSFLSTDFNTSISDQNITYNTSVYDTNSDLKTLNAYMENNIIDNNISDINISRLTSSDIIDIESLVSSYFKVNETTLTNSTFAKTKTINGLIEDIWNVAFSQTTGGDYESFDIGIEITKKDSTTKVNIVLNNVSLVNGTLTLPNSINVYGEKKEGSSTSTSSKTYSSSNSSDQTLINGSVAYLQSLFGINLGYIINNQDLVSSSRLLNAGTYYIKIYVEKIDLKASSLSENTNLQIDHSSNKLFTTTDTQYISGTIVISE